MSPRARNGFVAASMAALVLLGWLASGGAPRPAAQESAASISAPVPVAEKHARRVTFTPPPDHPAADRAPEAERVLVMSRDLPEGPRSYLGAVSHSITTAVIAVCVHPWMADNGVTGRIEMVWETTTGPDGLVEMNMLYEDEIAPEVVECMREVLWEAPWPELPVEGELVGVNEFSIDPPKRVPPPDERQALRARELETVRSVADAMREVYLAEP